MAFELLEYAKRVAVRRVVYVLVALLLAGFGIGRAEAQQYANCLDETKHTLSELCEYRDQAYTGAKAAAIAKAAAWPGSVFLEYRYTGGTQVTAVMKRPTGHEVYAQRTWSKVCPPGSDWNPATNTCSKNCANEPDLGSTTAVVPPGTETNPWINTPSTICVDGCEFWGSLEDGIGTTVDGQQYVTYSSMTSAGKACSAGTASGSSTPPPADGDGDGSSDGNDPAPNNPGQGGGGSDGPPGEDGSQGNGTSGSGPNGGQGNGAGEGSGNGNTAGGGRHRWESLVNLRSDHGVVQFASATVEVTAF